jgi:hypothetical protein
LPKKDTSKNVFRVMGVGRKDLMAVCGLEANAVGDTISTCAVQFQVEEAYAMRVVQQTEGNVLIERVETSVENFQGVH